MVIWVVTCQLFFHVLSVNFHVNRLNPPVLCDVSFGLYRKLTLSTYSLYNDFLRAGRLRSRSPSAAKVKNHHFSTSSRPALALTRPYIRRVPRAFLLDVKRPGQKLNTRFQLVSRSRKHGSIWGWGISIYATHFRNFVLLYFICYKFRSYDHPQVEMYISEINTTENQYVVFRILVNLIDNSDRFLFSVDLVSVIVRNISNHINRC
jgi:hypothetical protein